MRLCGPAPDGLTTKSRSLFPRVEDTDSRSLKVGYIPGRDRQTVYQGCGCDMRASRSVRGFGT